MFFKYNKNIVIGASIIITTFVLVIVASVILYNSTNKRSSISITVKPLQISNIYTSEPSYTDYSNSVEYVNFSPKSTDTYSADVAINEENFAATDSASSFEQVKSTSATGYNKALYDIADKNFIVYYDKQRVNPIFPLALANVETPGRADHSITWSALFPSRIVPIDLLDTMDVTTVVSNPEYQRALSAECSTRDRGALQMSPTYGTGIKEINEKMSGTEKSKLSTVDTSSYKGWASGASDKPGDRFKVSDVCLRLSSSMIQGINNMVKNGYEPSTDMQLVVQCAMNHHNSGVWYFSNHDKKVGNWISGQKAYEWSQVVSSDAMLKALSDYAKEHADVLSIDGKTATAIYQSCNSEPMSSYAHNSLLCTYPIKVLYAYIKLCMLYTS